MSSEGAGGVAFFAPGQRILLRQDGASFRFGRMVLPRVVASTLLLLCCGALLAGCDPGPRTPLDEQKDPHFLRGRNYVTALDFDNAIKSFEEALKANPNSASAHKELGLLAYQRRKDFARAIHHFQRLLELRPEDELAAIIRDYIVDCKRNLAREVTLLPADQTLQRNLELLEQLKKENVQLRQQNELLNAQLAQLRRDAEAARRAPPNPTLLTDATTTPVVDTPPRVLDTPPVPLPGTAGTNPSPVAARIHIVKAGETLSSISRRYGVSLQRLMEANPQVNPLRMQVGQELKIPSP